MAMGIKTHKNKENNAYYAFHNPKAYEFMPKDKEFESPIIINSGFYDDLFNQDAVIQYSKRLLNNMKESGIKESVYSNKSVPQHWKTKLTYRDEVSNALTKDHHFASYLNTKPAEDKTMKPFITSTPLTLPSLGLDSMESEAFKNETEPVPSTREKKKSTKMAFFSHQVAAKLPSKKDVESLLEQYRTQFSMRKFIDEFKEKHNKNLHPNGVKQNSTRSDYFSSHKRKKKNEKEEVFKSSIYVNLIPEAKGKLSFEEQMLEDEKKDLIENARQTYGEFLNVNTHEYNRKITITNPKIKRELELINYYGPRYSHCKLCHNKNLDYYQHNEPNQCLKLLTYLKRTRNSNPIALTDANAPI